MTRSDIGEYLGLTLETVSRVFSSLQKKELVLVKNREIEIKEMAKLKAILGE
jgi:CRP/FNR family transcriptional regulator